jgi:hypothetical protein
MDNYRVGDGALQALALIALHESTKQHFANSAALKKALDNCLYFATRGANAALVALLVYDSPHEQLLVTNHLMDPLCQHLLSQTNPLLRERFAQMLLTLTKKSEFATTLTKVEAVRGIFKLLEDNNPQIRRMAVFILRNLREYPTVVSLMSLSGGMAAVVKVALMLLKESKASETLEMFQAVLQLTANELPCLALIVRDDNMMKMIVEECFRTEWNDCHIVLSHITMCSVSKDRLREFNVIPLFARMLDTVDANIRSTAVTSLCNLLYDSPINQEHLRRTGCMKTLLKLCCDKDVYIQWNASALLYKHSLNVTANDVPELTNSTYRDSLGNRWDDPSRYLVMFATYGILPPMTDRLIVPMMLLLLDEDKEVRLDAIKILLQTVYTTRYHEVMCEKGIIPALVRLFTDEYDKIRKYAVVMLHTLVKDSIAYDVKSDIKAADGIATLLQILADPVPEVRNHAVDILFHVKYFDSVAKK